MKTAEETIPDSSPPTNKRLITATGSAPDTEVVYQAGISTFVYATIPGTTRSNTCYWCKSNHSGNQTNPMQDEYLTRCVVDPVSRKFFLYSNEGEERVVDCETVDQFMAVLELVRDKCDEDTLAYADPLTKNEIVKPLIPKKGRKKSR